MELALAIIKFLVMLPRIGTMIEKAIASFLAQAEERQRVRIQNASIALLHAKTKQDKQAALDLWFHAGGN